MTKTKTTFNAKANINDNINDKRYTVCNGQRFLTEILHIFFGIHTANLAYLENGGLDTVANRDGSRLAQSKTLNDNP